MAASMINAKVFSNYVRIFGLRLAKSPHRNDFINVKSAKTLRFYSEKSDTPVSSDGSCKTEPAPAYRHVPSKKDKYFLVWTNKYPSIKDIPEYVTRETMDKANNKARIYINILMGVITAIGAIVMIILGKKAAKRGETVAKMNRDWHESMNEKK